MRKNRKPAMPRSNTTVPSPLDNPISENNQNMRLKTIIDPGLRSIGSRVNPLVSLYELKRVKKSMVIACYCTNMTPHYSLGLSPKEA